MSRADADKWDDRYRAGAYAARPHPAAYLAAWAPRVVAGCASGSSGHRALDVACGAGRNAFYLAALGFVVDAVDVSAAGLARAREAEPDGAIPINWVQHDLDDELPPAFGPYTLIAMFRYVNLPLLGRLAARLEPGGYLVCEEHLKTDAVVAGPRSAEFRVGPHDLAAAASGLDVVEESAGLVVDPDGEQVALARLVARRL